MTLPEALKRARKSAGLPQSRVAAAAGVSTTQYQNYEYGKSEPTAGVLIALSNYFHVSIDYLTGKSDNPLRAPETIEDSIRLLMYQLGIVRSEKDFDQKGVRYLMDAIRLAVEESMKKKKD